MAVTGASNLIGTTVDLAPIVAAAHAVGARVFVDAVHLAPHRRIDVAALGCDVLVTSPYKWYGPHAGVLCGDPALLDALPAAKVRPAADTGPRRWETGTPNFEAIAAIAAAAEFLLDEGLDRIGADEARLGATLLDGLGEIGGVRLWGPATMDDRVPTFAFTVDGQHPDDVAAALAAAKVAAWSGHNVAVETVDQLGLADTGGVVRVGVVAYVDDDDVERLLTAVRALADADQATASSMRASSSSSRESMTSRAAKFSDTWLGRLAPVITVDTFGFIGAPRQGELGERAAELVGDRPQALDPRHVVAAAQAVAQPLVAGDAAAANRRGCRRGTCRSAAPTPAGSTWWPRSRCRRTTGRTRPPPVGGRAGCTPAAR